MDEEFLWIGAENTLRTILNNWTDDIDLNRQMIEMLLSQAILNSAGLEG